MEVNSTELYIRFTPPYFLGKEILAIRILYIDLDRRLAMLLLYASSSDFIHEDFQFPDYLIDDYDFDELPNYYSL